MNEQEQYVRSTLATMRDIGHDPEWLHSLEDDLYGYVLTAVANGHPDSQALAQMALETQQMNFERWCG